MLYVNPNPFVDPQDIHVQLDSVHKIALRYVSWEATITSLAGYLSFSDRTGR